MDLHIRWYKAVVLDRYSTFSGRAGRREYWTFTLLDIIIFIILDWLIESGMVSGMAVYFRFALGLFLFIPGWTVYVRRLHDVGKSGWLIIWSIIIPFILAVIAYPFGLIALLGMFYPIYLTFLKGEPGANKYGEPAPTEP